MFRSMCSTARRVSFWARRERQECPAESRDRARAGGFGQGFSVRPAGHQPARSGDVCYPQPGWDGVSGERAVRLHDHCAKCRLSVAQPADHQIESGRHSRQSERSPGIRRAGPDTAEIPQRTFGRHATARGDRSRGGNQASAVALRFAYRRPRSDNRTRHHGR